jgi:hypothetical protein
MFRWNSNIISPYFPLLGRFNELKKKFQQNKNGILITLNVNKKVRSQRKLHYWTNFN